MCHMIIVFVAENSLMVLLMIQYSSVNYIALLHSTTTARGSRSTVGTTTATCGRTTATVGTTTEVAQRRQGAAR